MKYSEFLAAPGRGAWEVLLLPRSPTPSNQTVHEAVLDEIASGEHSKCKPGVSGLEEVSSNRSGSLHDDVYGGFYYYYYYRL